MKKQIKSNETKTQNHKFLKPRALTLLAFLCLAVIGVDAVSAADGDVIHVNGSGGNDSWNGTSWDTAKQSIKNATGTVNNNGIVNIADGTYTGSNNRNITIDRNMTIIGQSLNGTIIDAEDSDRMFYINSDVNVTIQNLTLTGGNATYGGAIHNDGDLTVSGSTFSGNTAYGGGTIYNRGTLDVSGSVFSGNNASNGGAIYNGGSVTVNGSTFTGNTAYWGGTISNEGILDVTDSIFTNNTEGLGGVIYNYGGSVTVSDSTFIGNTADYGGAIYNYGGSVTVSDSTFTNNIAYNGGAIWNSDTLGVKDSVFQNNNATWSGGAIHSGSGSVTVSGSTFTNNTTKYHGGAIGNSDLLSVKDSVFQNNNADYGGAIENNGTLDVSGSNFSGNTANNGGAIWNHQGSVTVNNSTFTENTANLGGAIENDGTSDVSGSIFTGNTAYFGGAIWNSDTLTVNFCWLAGNTLVDIYNKDGSVDAECNWWGTNFEGTDPVTAWRIANAVVSKWMVLSISADPTTVHNGETSTVTVDLLHDQEGVYYDPVSGHVPEGIPVTFSASDGTINPASSVLVGGTATSIFTAGASGVATITATIDDQTVSVQITDESSGDSGSSGSTVKAAGKTVSMQKTGLPFNYLLLAVLMVVSGLLVPKRK